MSDSSRGGGKKTVFNPGGRRPQKPPSEARGPSGRPMAELDDRPLARDRPDEPRWAPSEPTAEARSSSGPRYEGPPVSFESVEEVPNRNPLLRAATPILVELVRLRKSAALNAPTDSLLQGMTAAIARFEESARDRSVTQEQVRTAKYIVCATVDDIMQNIPVVDRARWAQYNMQARFFGAAVGGEQFFTELDKAKQNPAVNYFLLELFHACLALGFRGQGGAEARQKDLYRTLRAVRERSHDELSPHWQGLDLPLRDHRFRVPYWAVAACAGAFLAVLFLVLRSWLADGAGEAADALALIVPDTFVSVDHVRVDDGAETSASPPAAEPEQDATTQLQRVRDRLKPEIENKDLIVDETQDYIFVRVSQDVSFDSGKDTVKERLAPLVKRIAAALETEPGDITVVGFTDDDPIHNSVFADNFALSQSRAEKVASLLSGHLSDAGRVRSEGRGENDPIGDNKTEEGKRLNRRVDVRLPHEQQ